MLISILSFGQKKVLTPFKKGDVRLELKLPHVNYLSVNPAGEFRDDKAGFNGYGIGLEYSYNDNRFLETSASFVMTFEFPFPAPVDREYNKAIYSYYFSLTDNVVVNRFTIGYGLNYSSNHWSEWYRNLGSNGSPLPDSKYYSNETLGATLNAYYRGGRSRHVGIIYRPTLLKVNGQAEVVVEHLVSLEFNWRIRLNRT